MPSQGKTIGLLYTRRLILVCSETFDITGPQPRRASHQKGIPYCRISCLSFSGDNCRIWLIIPQTIVQLSKGDIRERNILNSIYGLLFFGVPNQGMDIRSLIAMSQGQVNETFCRTLGPDSTVLRELNREFPQAFPFPDSPILSFYETNMSPTAQKVFLHPDSSSFTNFGQG
jgi:hypothetical protein